MMELKGHPWFLGCQFHPELKSRPLDCHPLFRGLIQRRPCSAARTLGARSVPNVRGAADGRLREQSREVTAGEVVFGGDGLRADRGTVRDRELPNHRCGMPTGLLRLRAQREVPIVFKSSFDKANRTSLAARFADPALRRVCASSSASRTPPGCRPDRHP